MKTNREKGICVICETKNAKSPWIICHDCGEFVVKNWHKEAYKV